MASGKGTRLPRTSYSKDVVSHYLCTAAHGTTYGAEDNSKRSCGTNKLRTAVGSYTIFHTNCLAFFLFLLFSKAERYVLGSTARSDSVGIASLPVQAALPGKSSSQQSCSIRLFRFQSSAVRFRFSAPGIHTLYENRTCRRHFDSGWGWSRVKGSL